MPHFTVRPVDGAAWITGASSGIGRAVALLLAAKGFTVHATARSADDLDALASEASGLSGRIVATPGDVTDPEAMTAIVERIIADTGPLALAIFNAGVFLPVSGEALQASRFKKTFDVNLMGVVNGLVPAVGVMKPAGRGQIAIVSSVAGYSGLPSSAAYGASKAGLTNMAESLKFDFDKLGIRIQVIHPGFVETPATEKNPFEMPALMKVDDAAGRIVEGLASSSFEITFPRRFTYVLKFLRMLPYPLYFTLMNKATGWEDRPLETAMREDKA
ncbi:short-subunit dehydrogenase [Hoeflea marina]|uniref:Short-subunit dehydrogenase n=1 Tax=Hoeflea marina TaxID=274592 RepID=A0A317PRZ0_9HYPH|nr:SDR family NAD(P)-dependent oxidoreductase [Hoeflea marina]PWW04228.1 short-subunit dehydrogenase [Hoeflea marina]